MNAELQKAGALVNKGDVAGAEKLLASRWPDPAQAPAEVFYLFALIRRAQKRIEEAKRHLAAAIKADGAQARYHFALGDLLASTGDMASAADAFAETLRLNATHPNARRAFARTALNADRFEDAERAARQLLYETRDDADAWSILSGALRGQERLDEAVSAGEEALRLDPDSIAARHDWAVAIGRVGRVEEALAAFEELAARGVTASGIAINRGAALLELGRAEEAERVFEDALAQWPGDMGLQAAVAKARWLRGAGEDFTALYEDAIARNPNSAQFRVGCVDLLRAAGFAERAEALLQKGLLRRPSDPILLDALAMLLDDADRLDEALPLLEAAVMRAPTRSETRTRWILALLRKGRAAEALEQVRPMRETAPLHQAWIAIESLALRQLGDPRYNWLCDYDLMVQAYDLAPPPGFSSIAAFNEALAASLMRLHVARDHPIDQSLRQGTQTTRNLTQIDDPIIRAYLDGLNQPIRQYIGLMRDPDHPWSGRKSEHFKLAGAWSVRLRGGGFHVNHIHPAGWISSAYYVSLPPSMSAEAGQAGWIKFGEPPSPTPGCSIEKVIEPKPGRLVLFPSYMWHGTIPFAEGERMTAPFDVVPI